MGRFAPFLVAMTMASPALAGGLADTIVEIDAIEQARLSGVCGDRAVSSAAFNANGQLEVVCSEDATAFIPLAGGLLPLLGAAALPALLSAAGGGTATPDTQ